jgi:nitrate/nitrite transporter NarK
MKRVYLFMFIGILAVVMIVVSLMNFNHTVESWSSLLAGAAIGLFILGIPSIRAWYKKTRQKNIK